MPADFEALARQAVETQAAGLVEKFLDMLCDSGIAHRARIPCSKLVVAMCNRGGYGVNSFDVQDNLSDIASTHWYDKLFKGVCTDIQADEFDALMAFNIEQVAAANGLLAEVEPNKATYQTLCGGHTTQGMKAIEARCPHWDDDLTLDGRLSIIMVAEKSPAYAEAIRMGAEYTIVPSWVLKKFPGLDNAIQAAGNTGQNIAKAVNDPQMLQRVSAMVQANSSFDQVRAEFKKTRPKNLEALPGMYNLIRKFPDAILINGLIKYIKSFDTKRKVSEAAFDALQTDYKGFGQAPRIRFGVLAALYVDEKQDLLTPSTIKGMGSDKKIADTLAADQTLKELYEKIQRRFTGSDHEELKNNSKALMSWYGLCADVVAHRCDKNTSAVTKYLADMKKPADYAINIKHLLQLCVQRIFTDTGIKLTDEFSAYELTVTEKPKPAGKETTEKLKCVRSSDDITSQMMLELGFKVDDVVCAVKREKGAEIITLKITKMENGKIHFHGDDKTWPPADLAEFQQKRWRHFTTATVEDRVWYDYEEEHCQHSSPGNTHSFVKATAMVAVFQAWNDETLVSKGVQVSMQPKAACAKEKFTVGSLVLAPNSQSVAIREIKDNEQTTVYGSAGLFMGVTSIDDKLHGVFAVAVPPKLKKEHCKNTRDTLMVPFWMLEATDKEEDANMKLTIDARKTVIDANEPKIQVPLIKNFRTLKVDDKLVLFVPPAMSLNPKPALKKQKTIKK